MGANKNKLLSPSKNAKNSPYIMMYICHMRTYLRREYVHIIRQESWYSSEDLIGEFHYSQRRSFIVLHIYVSFVICGNVGMLFSAGIYRCNLGIGSFTMYLCLCFVASTNQMKQFYF